MGRPTRRFEADGCYFVTVRCFQARALLRPSAETNAAVGGTLARAVELHGVQLFGFAAAVNHLDLLVRTPRGNLPNFMQYLLANVARKVGRLVGWRSHLWHQRYRAVPVLDAEGLVGGLRCILAHGVQEGWVRRCADWPGVSCLAQLLGDPVRTFHWLDWTRRWKCTQDVLPPQALMDERWVRPVQLRLEPLPCWAHLSAPVRRERIRELVASIERDGRVSGSGVRGRRAALEQNPQRPPPRAHRSWRPPSRGRAGQRRVTPAGTSSDRRQRLTPSRSAPRSPVDGRSESSRTL